LSTSSIEIDPLFLNFLCLSSNRAQSLQVPSRDPDFAFWGEEKKEIKREKFSWVDVLSNTGAFECVVFQVHNS